MSDTVETPLRKTPLHDLHVELGARMVPFAGYAMPVQFPDGILAEHRQVREAAGLFDVSHMGQVRLRGAGADRALESLLPGNVVDLADGRQRYSQFTNEEGGILDDLMISRLGAEELALVVNAACKQADIAHLRARLEGVEIEERADLALLALQGPAAGAVLAALAPAAEALVFMQVAPLTIDGIDCLVSRSGYTGEDGFEISCPADAAERLARRLLAEPAVRPIGLGARDSLRLEAGLCLYGHDIDETTSPVEAGLAWSIGKRRRAEGGYPGAATIGAQLEAGPPRKRVGLVPEGRAPVREGCEIVDGSDTVIGRVTSGGFAASVGGPVAMGYVPAAHAEAGSELGVLLRGRRLAARVVTLPFAPHRYRRT